MRNALCLSVLRCLPFRFAAWPVLQCEMGSIAGWNGPYCRASPSLPHPEVVSVSFFCVPLECVACSPCFPWVMQKMLPAVACLRNKCLLLHRRQHRGSPQGKCGGCLFLSCVALMRCAYPGRRGSPGSSRTRGRCSGPCVPCALPSACRRVGMVARRRRQPLP